MKYLHHDAEGVYHLDHRLTPEVRAMLCAMSSRMPLGGIEARYSEVVAAVAEGIWDEVTFEKTWKEAHDPECAETFEPQFRHMLLRAEERLTTYPLHPKVQVFFDKFVKMYGHSSIMELTGSPSVYMEGISWYDAWLTFDNPLVSGQEFSTRAVRHKNWPMARSCFDAGLPHPGLKELHDGWFEVFEAELGWWKNEFQSPCPKCVDEPQAVKDAFRANEHLQLIRWDGEVNLSQGGEVLKTSSTREDLKTQKCKAHCTVKLNAPSAGRVGCTYCDWSEAAPVAAATFESLWDYFADTEHCTHERCAACEGTGKKHPTADKEPFRPALDRARCAIPGTIATGCAHTANLRTMARVLQTGSFLAQRGRAVAPILMWDDIRQGYEKAVPGLSEMGLREAVYSDSTRLASHLVVGSAEPEREVVLQAIVPVSGIEVPAGVKPRPPGERSYLDPALNQTLQVSVAYQCSLAAARDHHRHRTMYPWTLDVVRPSTGAVAQDLEIHPAYKPMSKIGQEKTRDLLRKSTRLYDEFQGTGNQMQAMLALPLGTRVRLKGQGGLRDVVYMLELRANAHGANFEYKAQAIEAMSQLKTQLEAADSDLLALTGL